MPDVGLTTATEPLAKDLRVIIKYSVEVEGLPVYTETYDVATLAREVAKDKAFTERLWLRRIWAAIEARDEPAFSATLTGKLAHGTSEELATE